MHLLDCSVKTAITEQNINPIYKPYTIIISSTNQSLSGDFPPRPSTLSELPLSVVVTELNQTFRLVNVCVHSQETANISQKQF